MIGLNHTFDLKPPMFEASKKITMKVQGVDHPYKMEMLPCGIGLYFLKKLVVTRNIHEFQGRVIHALKIPGALGIACFSLIRN